MDETTINQKSISSPLSEEANTALAAALSIHYIVIVIYTMATLVGTVGVLLLSFMNQLRVDIAGIALAILIPSLLTLHLLAVRGLKKRREWGRSTSVLLGLLLLLGFPFGTVLGLILLSQLFKFEFVDI